MTGEPVRSLILLYTTYFIFIAIKSTACPGLREALVRIWSPTFLSSGLQGPQDALRAPVVAAGPSRPGTVGGTVRRSHPVAASGPPGRYLTASEGFKARPAAVLTAVVVKAFQLLGETAVGRNA